MENFDEISKRLDELMAICSHEKDNESSLELEITAKKKENKSASLNQLFDELIEEYNTRNLVESLGGSFPGTDVSESVSKVTLAVKDYLHVSDENGERFVLIPCRNGEKFETGEEYHLYTKNYKGYDFIVTDCSTTEYSCFLPHLNGMETYERCAFIKKAKEDPEGFALWGRMGKVKRPDMVLESDISHKMTVQTRAEEFLNRIPKDRDDLYHSLCETLRRYKHSPGNEKEDREQDLRAKMAIIAMMLSSCRSDETITAECLTRHLDGAKVSVCNLAGNRPPDWLPNILIVGRDYTEVVKSVSGSDCYVIEISMCGVEAGDYLFGDPMCYVGTRIGELVSRLTETDTTPSVILFSDVDLMGTTVRGSNPLYGLAGLLRKHTFNDFYMRSLTVDVKNIQLICQVNRLEDCPELLMREIDIIVEL